MKERKIEVLSWSLTPGSEVDRTDGLTELKQIFSSTYWGQETPHRDWKNYRQQSQAEYWRWIGEEKCTRHFMGLLCLLMFAFCLQIILCVCNYHFRATRSFTRVSPCHPSPPSPPCHYSVPCWDILQTDRRHWVSYYSGWELIESHYFLNVFIILIIIVRTQEAGGWGGSYPGHEECFLPPS